MQRMFLGAHAFQVAEHAPWSVLDLNRGRLEGDDDLLRQRQQMEMLQAGEDDFLHFDHFLDNDW